jgi:hypothetical protein
MSKHTLDCNNTPCDILVVTSETNGNCPKLPAFMVGDTWVKNSIVDFEIGITTDSTLRDVVLALIDEIKDAKTEISKLKKQIK